LFGGCTLDYVVCSVGTKNENENETESGFGIENEAATETEISMGMPMRRLRMTLITFLFKVLSKQIARLTPVDGTSLPKIRWLSK